MVGGLENNREGWKWFHIIMIGGGVETIGGRLEKLKRVASLVKVSLLKYYLFKNYNCHFSF